VHLLLAKNVSSQVALHLCAFGRKINRSQAIAFPQNRPGEKKEQRSLK